MYIVKYFLTGYAVNILAGNFSVLFFVERNKILSVEISSDTLIEYSSMRHTVGFPIKIFLGLRYA